LLEFYVSEKIIIKADPDLIDLIPGYLDKRREDIGTIHALLADGNFEGIRILAHRMKGSGGGYGFDRITEIGAAMEIAAKDQSKERITHELEQLSEFLSRVEVVE